MLCGVYSIEAYIGLFESGCCAVYAIDGSTFWMRANLSHDSFFISVMLMLMLKNQGAALAVR
jgi:hypothetical protein